MSQKNNITEIQEFKPKLQQRRKQVSVINTILRWINISLTLAIFYGIYLLWNMDFWKIQLIEINGLTRIGSSYISKFELDKTYKDRHILTVNPLEILKDIKHDRIFKDIKIKRTLFPAKLEFEFLERKPYISIYEEQHGRNFTIDNEGFVLTFDDNSKKKVIHKIDEIKKYKLSSQQLSILKLTQTFLEKKKIPDIGTYDISNIDKIILKTKKNTIFLGNIDDMIMKIKSIEELENLAQKTKNELEYIDVSNWKNPVLKMKVKKKKELKELGKELGKTEKKSN
ncbi:MAG: hypothetical protein U0457_02160 [Candidatus Sericytochromatia bacterium]